MEPLDPAISLRGRQEPPCAIHGLGPCPHPVALRRSVLSSLSPREGGEEGEEGVTTLEGVDEVAVVMEDDDDEPVKVIPVPESPPRPKYKQTARIQIGPRGRPIETLEPQTGASEASWVSPETGSEVWPPPAPPPMSGTVRTESPPPLPTIAMTPPPPPPPPPPLHQEHTTPPPLLSPIGGRILCQFAQLANPSRLGHRSGVWEIPRWPFVPHRVGIGVG
jgi:hypothetical protein